MSGKKPGKRAPAKSKGSQKKHAKNEVSGEKSARPPSDDPAAQLKAMAEEGWNKGKADDFGKSIVHGKPKNRGKHDEGTGLSPQQETFCRKYILDFHATQAAIAAGYSAHTATAQASRLLTNVNIQARIKELLRPHMEEMDITQERVLRHQAAMAFSNIMDYVDVSADGRVSLNFGKAPREKMAAIKSIEITEMPAIKSVENGQEISREVLKTKVTLHDKPKTNEALMRHLGLVEPATTTNQSLTVIQNNVFANMTETEIVKRMAFALFRAKKPEVPRMGEPPAAPPPPKE